MIEKKPLLSVEGISKRYNLRRSLIDVFLRRPVSQLVAVDNVSFSINRGTVLGIVGESGSGKTTLARCLIRLIEPDTGIVSYSNKRIDNASSSNLRNIRKDIQMVFQDPYTSLNPRMSIGAALAEAGKVHGTIDISGESDFVSNLLKLVGLPSSFATRRPRQLSGGQRQRAAIARALAVRPTMLIADEAVSALDVSIQGQILNLFRELRKELELTIIFIAHQLSVISHVADEVAVMYLGKIVEHGTTKEIFSNPKHPYTKALMAAHPHPDPREKSVPQMQGDIPSPLDLPQGCRFFTRCPQATTVCSDTAPDLLQRGDDHKVACHF
ncbi:MAG: peptide ABC transporter substrate-binding protein [Acidiferrobacteraceae bacterium]|nr:peptide ABC transporter substrate-binding protein [Acidiferrobacteraceae bacterium]|tara:strand:+ start:2237 stop:3214 length:978 start_codon:yes stop_codon:yes gene_type:complete